MTAATALTRESALVVDDSCVQRAHAAALCRTLGMHTIYEAGNGKEALALLEHVSPDLLIVDLEMPTMDGPQLLSQLRSREVDIPILLVSSRDEAIIQSVQLQGRALGLTILGTMRKPLDLERFRQALNTSIKLVEATAIQPALIDEESLRSAIQGGQLITHYQPQIELSTGCVRGVEALVRWRHPSAGMVAPDRFIPLAESRGLIHPLTLRVLNDAMLHLARWRSEGHELTMAINLSPLLLGHAGLVEDISTLTQAYDLVPQNLVFEVTETSLFDKAAGLEVLNRLRLRGYGLSLDDYGTGYSSMQQLAQVPFTELKIDRSFVHGVATQQSLQVLVRSAIAMARELGLTTVAEGVESRQELEFLRNCGCTLAQGWLFSQALPAEDLVGWMLSHRQFQPPE